jgi:hypothetical protein
LGSLLYQRSPCARDHRSNQGITMTLSDLGGRIHARCRDGVWYVSINGKIFKGATLAEAMEAACKRI